MPTTGNRKMDETGKVKPVVPFLPKPVIGPPAEAKPVKPAPDAGLQPVKPPPAQTQSVGGGAGATDASLRRSFTQDAFMSQLNGAAGQNTQGAGVTIPESALKPTYNQGAADPDAPAVAGTTVTNSSPFTGPTGTPTSTEYPTVVPGKVYTQAELVAFEQAMSAADQAEMRAAQRTLYRPSKYSDKPSGAGWVSIPLASGGYYEYKAEPEWQDYWSTSPHYGTTGAPGAGTSGTGTGGTGTGTGGTGSAPGMFDDLVGGTNPATNLTNLLEEWKKAASAQANGQIDFAVQQAILDLERALADAQGQFKEQAESVAKDEMQALDNSALYAEMRGDKGGIGQSQYNEIQAAAAQNRLAVQQAQTKLSTDTARQIADLRAQGEFEKADKLLEITQTYLSQLMSLEQWQAEFGLSQKQFEASLRQWQAEFDQAVEEFNFGKTKWETEFNYGVNADKKEWALQLMSMGFDPSNEDLKLLGLSRDQWDTWKKEQQLKQTQGGGNPAGDPTESVVPPLGTTEWLQYVANAAHAAGQTVRQYIDQNYSDLHLQASMIDRYAEEAEDVYEDLYSPTGRTDNISRGDIEAITVAATTAATTDAAKFAVYNKLLELKDKYGWNEDDFKIMCDRWASYFGW